MEKSETPDQYTKRVLAPLGAALCVATESGYSTKDAAAIGVVAMASL